MMRANSVGPLSWTRVTAFWESRDSSFGSIEVHRRHLHNTPCEEEIAFFHCEIGDFKSQLGGATDKIVQKWPIMMIL
jgi:hypothetical protein